MMTIAIGSHTGTGVVVSGDDDGPVESEHVHTMTGYTTQLLPI